MGGFFLIAKKEGRNKSVATDMFKKRGLTKFSDYDFGSYELRIFEKINVASNNEYKSEYGFAVSVGTFLYKEYSPKESVQKYFEDFVANRISESEIRGCFVIFIKRHNEFYIVHDAADNYLIFYDKTRNIISSSFLALGAYSAKHFNKQSLLEILNLGFTVGDETLFDDIFRYHGQATVRFSNIHLIKNCPNYSANFSSQNESLETQINHLGTYFKVLIKHFDGNTIFGLTGGLDSRLILALAHSIFSDYSIFSYGRDSESLELHCARELAKVVKKQLTEVPITPVVSLSDEKIAENMHAGYLYNDGIVSADNYWVQEHHTLMHRVTILGGNKLNIHGVGGEHYRNHLKLIEGQYNLKEFLRYQIIESRIGNIWRNKKDQNDFYSKIIDKINLILGFPSNKTTYSSEELFLVYEKIFNPFFRSIRIPIDNTVTYSIGPFTEFLSVVISMATYPYIGKSLQYETEMIKRINGSIAAAPTDYGFSFVGQEPYFYRNIDSIKNIIGVKNYHLFLRYLKSLKAGMRVNKNMTGRHLEVLQNLDALTNINSFIDTAKVANGEFGPLLPAITYTAKGN